MANEKESRTSELKLSAWTAFFAAISTTAALAIPASFLRLYYPAFENRWILVVPVVFVIVFALDHLRLVDVERFRDAVMSAFTWGLVALVSTGIPLGLILLTFYPNPKLNGNFALPQMTGGFAFLIVSCGAFLYKFAFRRKSK